MVKVKLVNCTGVTCKYKTAEGEKILSADNPRASVGWVTDERGNLNGAEHRYFVTKAQFINLPPVQPHTLFIVTKEFYRAIDLKGSRTDLVCPADEPKKKRDGTKYYEIRSIVGPYSLKDRNYVNPLDFEQMK